MDLPAWFTPQALAAAVAAEVHSHATCRRLWLRDTTAKSTRPRSDACTGQCRRKAPSCIPPPSGAHRGPVEAAPLPCYSPARRRTEHAATRSGDARRGCASPCTRRAPHPFFRRSLLWALQFEYPVPIWQAEETVGNLPLRLAVRVHCGHQVLRGTLGVKRHSTCTPWVLTEYPGGYSGRQYAARNALLSSERAFPSVSCRLERACAAE